MRKGPTYHSVVSNLALLVPRAIDIGIKIQLNVVVNFGVCRHLAVYYARLGGKIEF